MNSSKYPVNPNWFTRLEQAQVEREHAWMIPFSATVDTIANFGCWRGVEPFALLWTLDATEVMVVEKKKKHEIEFNKKMNYLKRSCPESLFGRKVDFVLADMTEKVNSVPSAYFDLAYCRDTLYYMQDDPLLLEEAIKEMVRVVKEGGLLVVVDSKYKARYEKQRKHLINEFAFDENALIAEPKDMSHLFDKANLVNVTIENLPHYTYCYRKTLV